MSRAKRLRTWMFISLVSLLFICAPARAEIVNVACSTDFVPVLFQIKRAFEGATAHQIRIAIGSTGELHAAIMNGANHHVFLAADSTHPRALESAGLAVPGSRTSYAVGRLVLWQPYPNRLNDPLETLQQRAFDYLAMGNPALEPYGAAAQQVLTSVGLWPALSARVLTGATLAHTFAQLQTRQADLGFVGLSQIKNRGPTIPGYYWTVPGKLYRPILQQAVLLAGAPEAAAQFLRYLQTTETQQLIATAGYDLPGISSDHERVPHGGNGYVVR
ncbi:MAG: molybdate ABC transporter substrate-binding protein [Pseudomonadota bacterium]|nr:molybdate ABC transporter substrate-binding protein [Pseudomonadota bacterium]